MGNWSQINPCKNCGSKTPTPMLKCTNCGTLGCYLTTCVGQAPKGRCGVCKKTTDKVKV